MCNISVSLEKSGTISNLYTEIDEILEKKPTALTLLISSGNGFTKELLDPLLTNLKIPVSGGIFHKIIFKDSLLDKGTILIAWHNEVAITNYKNIENIHSLRDLVGISSNPSVQGGKHLVFVDGAVSKLEESLDALYKKNGFQATFAGGGAGSEELGPSPCIVSNEGLLINTMQTLATNYKSNTTVTHGLKKESGPHLVTTSNRTCVETLNYEPIVPFYENHNTEYGKQDQKSQNFSDFFKYYPIGIENLDGDILVRDPIKFSKKSIKYCGNIPEYSKVHILGGTTQSIRNEVDNELYSLKLKDEENIDATFIFSCAHRDDTDEDGLSKEVAMLHQHLGGSKHVFGVLALGEIATSESKLLQLHSKTIVITRLVGNHENN